MNFWTDSGTTNFNDPPARPAGAVLHHVAATGPLPGELIGSPS